MRGDAWKMQCGRRLDSSRVAERLRLADLVARGSLLLNDGYRTRADELGRPGIPVLRVAEVQQGHLTPTFGDHVLERYRSKIAEKVSRPGDVVVTTKGTVGRVARVAPDDAEFVYSPQVCFFRCLDDTFDSRWLYYWFCGPEFTSQAAAVQSQTDMAAYINLADMRAIGVTLPPTAEQRAVAAALGALDDKIESNRRQTNLIDTLLGAEFAAISARHLARTSLNDLATFTKGVSYRSTELSPSGGTCLVTLKSVGRSGGYQSSGLKPYIGHPKAAQVLLPGELVVAQTDLTQAADVIGRVVRVPKDASAGRLVASLDLVIVRPRDRTPVEYLYGVLLEDRFRQHCRARSSGTTVLHLSRDALPEYAAPEVPFEEQESFALLARPLLDKQDTLTRESTRLAALRDALLPELLSGRIRVREAIEAVDHVLA